MVKQGIIRVLFVCCLLAHNRAEAQLSGIKASVNRNHILIGEPIVLQLEAQSQGKESPAWYAVDSIAHFEIIDRGKIDTLKSAAGILYRQKIVLTSFDSGSQVIPPLPVSVSNNRYLTDTLKVEVGYSDADPNRPYHDIKDIVEVAAVKSSSINLVIALVTLAALLVIILLLRRRKKVQAGGVIVPEEILSPYERAAKALQALRAEGVPDSGQVKQYYSRLNDVLRNYLRDEKLVTAPDSNNADLAAGIREKVPRETMVKLVQSLRVADAVKFAKFQPEDAEHKTVLESISEAVEAINQNHQKPVSA